MGLPAQLPLLPINQSNPLPSRRKSLSRHGFNVETAEDGVQAFEKLESIKERIEAGDKSALPIDLILLDLVMPHMDGKAVLQRLKETPEVRARGTNQ